MTKVSYAVVAALALGLTSGTGCIPIDGGSNNVGGGRELSGTIEENMTLSGTNTVVGGLQINAILTIEECSTLRISGTGVIDVDDGGAIVVEGSEDCPVNITSDKGGPGAGDWSRFDIWDSSSNNNSFTHTVFEYGGSDPQWGMVWVEAGADVAFSNVTFRDSGGHAAYFESGANVGDFSNVRMENIERAALAMGPNEVGALSPIDAESDVPSIEVRGGSVSDDQTWVDLEIPLIIAGRVGINAAVDIEAGTEVQLGPGVIVDVDDGGTLQANGTSDAPVTFTSSKSSPGAGDWARFDIWSSSGAGNVFEYTVVEYGGSDPTYGAIWVEGGANITFDNVTFSENDGCDVYDQGTVDATASDYTSCL